MTLTATHPARHGADHSGDHRAGHGAGVVSADPYPTRISGEPELIDRIEPTIWSDGMEGPIDPATLAAHEIKGYSIHPDLLSPAEVETYRQELTRLSADPALRDDERLVLDPESGEVRCIFEAHRHSELISELISDPRVLDRARQVLGSEVYVHQSRVNYLPGFTGKGSYWHADFETWHAEDGMPGPRAVGMSIALTPSYAFNGGPMVLPGSHRMFVPCVDPSERADEDSPEPSSLESNNGVPDQEQIAMLAGAYGIDQFTAAEGAVLMFDANVMHGSGNNITPYPRSTIFVVFNSMENTLVEPFAAERPRPTYLASREFDPLHR